MSELHTARRQILVNNAYPDLLFSPDRLERCFQVLDSLGFAALPPGELSIVFLDDAAMAKLHADFLNDPTPTDVITFPGDAPQDVEAAEAGEPFAGEICVSVDQARRVSTELEHPFPRELLLYLVHGWLHLAGFRDDAPEAIERMRTAEAQALEAIEKAWMLPDFRCR